MQIIGICGASGSGKSTLVRAIQGELRADCAVLEQDVYYREHPNTTLEERKRINYDAPEALDMEGFFADVCALRAGQAIRRRAYDYANHCPAPAGEWISPPEILLVEGIHVFYDERLTDMMALKLFVDLDVDICILRRLCRDVRERGRDVDGIVAQYMDTVRPMYERYVRNYRSLADIIVPNMTANPTAVKVICAGIRMGLPRNKE